MSEPERTHRRRRHSGNRDRRHLLFCCSGSHARSILPYRSATTAALHHAHSLSHISACPVDMHRPRRPSPHHAGRNSKDQTALRSPEHFWPSIFVLTWRIFFPIFLLAALHFRRGTGAPASVLATPLAFSLLLTQHLHDVIQGHPALCFFHLTALLQVRRRRNLLRTLLHLPVSLQAPGLSFRLMPWQAILNMQAPGVAKLGPELMLG